MATIQQLINKIPTGKLPRVMGMGGSEKALMGEALVAIREKVLEPSTADFNYQRFDLSQHDFSEVLAAANSLPFLARERLLEVTLAEKLTPPQVKELGQYIANPSGSSYLILCFDKFDKRSSVVTLLTKAQLMFECQPLSEREVVDLMVQEAKACGLRLSRSAAQLMVGFLEGDLLACRQALEKLRLSLGGGEVAEDDVLKHITEVGAPDAFALVRAIAEGNLKEALPGLMRMRNALESPLKFLGLLQWQMRILVSLKHYLDQGLPEFEAGRAAGIFGDRLGWMVKIARKKNMSFHTARLTRILAADSALKSVNSAYPYNFIEKVVYQCAVGM